MKRVIEIDEELYERALRVLAEEGLVVWEHTRRGRGVLQVVEVPGFIRSRRGPTESGGTPSPAYA